MVTKNKNLAEKEVTKSRVKVGKLQLGKETIKDLSPGKQKHIQGGKMDDSPETYCVPARVGLPAENQVQHSDHRKGFKHGNETLTTFEWPHLSARPGALRAAPPTRKSSVT